jgi:hypothetical protein
MPRLQPNLRLLCLLCFPIVLAGCQHPLASSGAGKQASWENRSLAYAGRPELIKTSLKFPSSAIKPQASLQKTFSSKGPQPADEPLMAVTLKEPECLTIELGDALMQVFKTFTDRP